MLKIFGNPSAKLMKKAASKIGGTAMNILRKRLEGNKHGLLTIVLCVIVGLGVQVDAVQAGDGETKLIIKDTSKARAAIDRKLKKDIEKRRKRNKELEAENKKDEEREKEIDREIMAIINGLPDRR